MHRILIAVLTFNRLEVVRKCITDILSKKRNYPVMIWDNNSIDGTFEWLQDFKDYEFGLIRSRQNIGLKALKIINDRYRPEFLLKVDSDILVPEYFADILLDAALSFNLVSVSFDTLWGKSFLMDRLRDLDGIELISWRGNTLYKGKSGRFFCPLGGCRLMKGDILDKSGTCDLMYGTDYIIGQKLNSLGFEIGVIGGKDYIIHNPGNYLLYETQKGMYNSGRSKEIKWE